MRPLSALTGAEGRAVAGLLFDLDDTVLSHGELSLESYAALWSLREAGIPLVAVTGRPSGWGEVIARQWPVDAAITENGAVVIARQGRSLHRVEACDAEERKRRRERLAGIVARVREVVPEARLADDVDARTSDVAWDVGETVSLAEDRVAAIVREIRAAGARTTRSSVHVHASFETHDKASGTLAWLCSTRGEDAGSALGRWAFVGDSGNDRACFSAFRTTFGVANVRAALASLPVPPRFVSDAPMGCGFAEIARALLAARAHTT